MPTNWRTYVVPALFVALVAALGLSYFEGRKAGEYAVKFRSADSTVKEREKDIAQQDDLFAASQHDYLNLLQRFKAATEKSATPKPVTKPGKTPTVATQPIPAPPITHPVTLEDSTLNACSAVLHDCEGQRIARDNAIAALNAKIKLLEHQPHSFFSGIGGKALILGGGFLLGRALH